MEAAARNKRLAASASSLKQGLRRLLMGIPCARDELLLLPRALGLGAFLSQKKLSLSKSQRGFFASAAQSQSRRRQRLSGASRVLSKERPALAETRRRDCSRFPLGLSRPKDLGS